MFQQIAVLISLLFKLSVLVPYNFRPALCSNCSVFYEVTKAHVDTREQTDKGSKRTAVLQGEAFVSANVVLVKEGEGQVIAIVG